MVDRLGDRAQPLRELARSIVAKMLVACREGAAPSPTVPIPLTVGSFVLESIDGNALPYPVVFEDSVCNVTGATLALKADTTSSWVNSCAGAGGSGQSGPFVQLARDTVAILSPLGYRPVRVCASGRRGGDSLAVTVFDCHSLYGGQHTWLFHTSPGP